MAFSKPVNAKKKKRVRAIRDLPFPIPIGEESHDWFYYTGYLKDDHVEVKHSGDIDRLYKMGFFGKGTLSRSKPEFNQQYKYVQVPNIKGENVHARVMSRRRYVHRLNWSLRKEGEKEIYVEYDSSEELQRDDHPQEDILNHQEQMIQEDIRDKSPIKEQTINETLRQWTEVNAMETNNSDQAVWEENDDFWNTDSSAMEDQKCHNEWNTNSSSTEGQKCHNDQNTNSSDMEDQKCHNDQNTDSSTMENKTCQNDWNTNSSVMENKTCHNDWNTNSSVMKNKTCHNDWNTDSLSTEGQKCGVNSLSQSENRSLKMENVDVAMDKNQEITLNSLNFTKKNSDIPVNDQHINKLDTCTNSSTEDKGEAPGIKCEFRGEKYSIEHKGEISNFEIRGDKSCNNNLTIHSENTFIESVAQQSNQYCHHGNCDKHVETDKCNNESKDLFLDTTTSENESRNKECTLDITDSDLDSLCQSDHDDGNLFVVDDSDSEVEYKRRKKSSWKKWRPVLKRDPYFVKENLHLSFEEAFFLSYGLGCLVVKDTNDKSPDLTEMWQTYSRRQTNFIPNYVAYHYYRSKGWVPKTGLKFGTDFLIYKEGPAFYHGSFSVIVEMVKEGTLVQDPSQRTRDLTWTALAGLNRLTEQVAKEILICHVIRPNTMTEEDLLTPSCIPKFQVKEILLSRWISSQEREKKTDIP